MIIAAVFESQLHCLCIRCAHVQHRCAIIKCSYWTKYKPRLLIFFSTDSYGRLFSCYHSHCPRVIIFSVVAPAVWKYNSNIIPGTQKFNWSVQQNIFHSNHVYWLLFYMLYTIILHLNRTWINTVPTKLKVCVHLIISQMGFCHNFLIISVYT